MTAVVLAWPRHLRVRCPPTPPGAELDWQCSSGTCVHVNLSLCSRCGGAEGDLPTDCPGVRMDYDVRELVYADRLNYVSGAGWVEPGDRMWRRNG